MQGLTMQGLTRRGLIARGLIARGLIVQGLIAIVPAAASLTGPDHEDPLRHGGSRDIRSPNSFMRNQHG
jgi:hypothetical protein